MSKLATRLKANEIGIYLSKMFLYTRLRISAAALENRLAGHVGFTETEAEIVNDYYAEVERLKVLDKKSYF